MRFACRVSKAIGTHSEYLIRTIVNSIKGKGHPITGHEGPRGGIEGFSFLSRTVQPVASRYTD
jgi:hypothetical protein